MQVYFVSPVGDSGRVKIGVTSDLDCRLKSLASDFADGVELLALCDGGLDVERAFHAIFAADRIEGEWFARSPALDVVISPLKNRVIGKRLWTRVKLNSDEENAISVDRQIARDLLGALLRHLPALGKGEAQQSAFAKLHTMNPLWSRRRVRAIWEMTATRIDHYEIRDLEIAVGNRRSEWSETIAPELRGE